MPLSRLELVSSHGDQTFSRVRFVLHGTANATESISIPGVGIRLAEGQPVVSTNLIHARDWAVSSQKQSQFVGGIESMGQPGAVFVCAVPQNFHLGYGIFTTAYVDRRLKRVSGAPLRYAGARNQLSFYSSSDTEKARVHIESEIANGYPISQHPQIMLEPKYIVGTFSNGAGFDALLSQLDVSVRVLEPVAFERMESGLASMFTPMIAANAVLTPTAIRDAIIGTIETMVMTRVRMMRWQGLALLGFNFFEGKQAVRVPPVGSLEEHRARIDELGRQLASSNLFSAELAWLKTYVAHELELMRVELEGSDL